MGTYSLLNKMWTDDWVIGPPILACVHKGVPGIFMDCHMMVAEPEKVCSFLSSTAPTDKGNEWVDDIAAAGGSLYCFHQEATSKFTYYFLYGL
jgi:ribulose-phosphate 3-epimerase